MKPTDSQTSKNHGIREIKEIKNIQEIQGTHPPELENFEQGKKIPAGLYSVAVPIGNTGDLSHRAREILENAAVVAAEQTPKFRDLARRAGLNIKGRVLAYHSHNEESSAKGLIDLIKKGFSVALVSSAGTPRVSDPGFHILRAAHQENLRVFPVPGPSALASAMSICPIPIEPLLFLGFITPRPGKRINTLKKYDDFAGTVGFYESVHRVEKLLEAIFETWGDVETFIGREMTKTHEDSFWGPISGALEWAKKRGGEYVILVKKENKK